MNPLSSTPVGFVNPLMQTEARQNLLWGADPQSCFNPEGWCVDSQMNTAYSSIDNRGVSQETMVHMDLRDVQALTSTADENRREVLSLLGHCIDDPKNLDQPNPYEQMVSQLDEILPERHKGEHAEYAERLKGLSTLEPAFQLICLSIHLSSNNLLSTKKTDKFVEWINKTGAQRVLERLLDLKMATTKILGRKILLSAARLGLHSIVQILIKKGVKVNGISHCMFGPTTALESAVSNDHFRCVQTLLDAGANPRQCYGSGSSLLSSALRKSNNLETLRILIEAGADVNSWSIESDDEDTPILTQAASVGDFPVGQLLIAAGARVNDMGPGSLTALQSSAEMGNVEFAELLIEAGADVDAPAGKAYRDAYDAAVNLREFSHLLTPIQIASDANNTELVVLLLRKGADVNACPWEQQVEELNSEIWLDSDEMKTALQAAVYNDNVTMIQILLMAGAKVNAPGGPFTALQIAARESNIRILRLLLKEGADVNAPARTKFGMTALQAAASEGDCEIVHALLDAGADINAPPSEGGMTALQEASRLGQIEIAKTLTGAGAHVNANPSPIDGRTCLQAAAEYGHIDLVSFLLENGANVNSPGAAASGGETALQAALSCSSKIYSLENSEINGHKISTMIFRKLLKAGAEVSPQSSPQRGPSTCEAIVKTCCPELLESILLERLDLIASLKSDSSLVLAVLQQSAEMISILMKAGAAINGHRRISARSCSILYDINGGMDAKTLTPLEAAVAVKSIPLTKLLLDSGAKLDGFVENLDFWTPLQWAIKQNSIEMVKILLEAGANPNATGKSFLHQTPLQEALSAESVNMDIITVLIDTGADPNRLVDQSTEFPLRSAAGHGCFKIVRRLLNAGAQVGCVSKDRTTALQAAVSSRNHDIIQLLVDAGANVNASAGPHFGRTAIQLAAVKGDMSLVQYLLDHGADVNAPAGHSHGITALQGAAINGNLKIAIMLLKAGAQINAPPAEVEGRYALDAAAEHGRLDIVYLLLKNDHEEAGKDLRCYRAAKFAVSNGHDILGRMLEEHAASYQSTV